ncbi:MAG: sulfur carrier protein ThiS [Panacagrimonas sp.]
MRLTVNGQSQQLADEANLVDLISALQLGGRRLAIELNGEIVPRSQHAQTTLSDGDQIEIVQAVGGG